jgi:transcriptional regulator GlxA family with amidase domain
MLEPEKGDIVVVIGGSAAPRRSVAAMSAWLRTHAPSCRLCGIGAGGDLLLRTLSIETPSPERRVADRDRKTPAPVQKVAQHFGSVWTCKGKAAALDMMLTLVAEDHGNPHAFRVAEALFMYIWRRPDEPLRSLIFDLQGRGAARFDQLHDYIRINLAEDLRVERLAELCGMTPRTFARLYLKETGMTPAAAVAGIRLEASRTLVEWHGMTLARISHLTGFGSEPSLRRAFLSAFGKLPYAMRDER